MTIHTVSPDNTRFKFGACEAKLSYEESSGIRYAHKVWLNLPRILKGMVYNLWLMLIWEVEKTIQVERVGFV
ncbi:hypothetical protein BCV72DRAFT_315802 [Rhizopus microsporus var. microsporus]|uniref:Uncharacterized protein n=1 Tax=Rhizopus microsporus var. microsporus TaxID=86635 RepID=A0A1X0RDN8_RHIZD|nr:hypothetical protein BCV72DRAFT_315802 [Rhizopus microsporus var. microsporus]